MESWEFKRLEELLREQIVLLGLIAKLLAENTPPRPNYSRPVNISVLPIK